MLFGLRYRMHPPDLPKIQVIEGKKLGTATVFLSVLSSSFYQTFSGTS
jgi:hypothetical protein